MTMKYAKFEDVEKAIVFSKLVGDKPCGEVKNLLNSIPKFDVDDCIKVPLPVLLEIMRFKAIPRPNIGDDNWIKVVECLEETIRAAEKWYENTGYDYDAFMRAKQEREKSGKEMIPILYGTGTQGDE